MQLACCCCCCSFNAMWLLWMKMNESNECMNQMKENWGGGSKSEVSFYYTTAKPTHSESLVSSWKVFEHPIQGKNWSRWKKGEKKKKLTKILWQLKILYIYLLCIPGTLGLYAHIFHSTFTIPASSNASLKKEYHPFL